MVGGGQLAHDRHGRGQPVHYLHLQHWKAFSLANLTEFLRHLFLIFVYTDNFLILSYFHLQHWKAFSLANFNWILKTLISYFCLHWQFSLFVIFFHFYLFHSKLDQIVIFHGYNSYLFNAEISTVFVCLNFTYSIYFLMSVP